MQLPKRRHEKFKKYDEGPIYLTQKGLDNLLAKLERLKKSLPGLIVETRRTAAYGDRSDNAEYKEAKSALRRTHWQILKTENQIKRVDVIKIGTNNSDTVRLGSTVILTIDGDQKTYQILGSHETDPIKGRISNESPLGKNLLGKKTGEIVSVQTKNGSKEYKIVRIE
jgi:transcription elongation factor GreA